MASIARNELILEGLNCASCGAKIEDRVKKLDNVEDATLNFVTKVLSIDVIDGVEVENIIEKIKHIVKTIEPEVVVKDKSSSMKKTYILKGLNCTNCATKIETETKKIDGVEDGYIDFVSMKLKIGVAEPSSIDRITNEIKAIVNRLEPHVEVIVEGDIDNDSHHTEEKEGIDKRKFLRFGIGSVVFLLALILKVDSRLEAGLFALSYVLIGGDIVLRAFKNIIRGQVFDENFLMTIATIGAFGVKEFAEGVAVMLFYQVGEAFQDLAVNRSRRSIKALLDIRPDYANLKLGKDTSKVDPKKVDIGDLIVIKPGEKVPLDGKIIEGEAMMDTSALTGESVPRKLKTGDEILSGFINKTGLLTVEVSKRFGESTVSKILDLVQNASSKKAPTESFITKFARYYTPAVVIAALATALIPPLIIDGATFSQWIYRALIFLVISCPCALVVSIPLGFFGGIGGSSKAGVLVKGGNYLEALNNVEAIVFDKTGTLTEGVFKVNKVVTTNGYTRDNLIRYSALAEIHSNHPIAKSIMEEYNGSLDKGVIKNYEEISGNGIKATIEGKEVLVGNGKLLNANNIAFEEANSSGTIVYVAIERALAGYLVISDRIKKDSKEAISALRSLGVKKLIMLTGDNKSAAEAVSNELELDQVFYELLPHDKVAKLEEIEKNKTDKGKMVFVGDGINDAPVLARADIGVAMGGLGSDAAIEAADVVIMNDEPTKLVEAINIAKRTRSIVIQNIAFALGTKGIVLLLGALGMATMWEAVFADVGVALIAVLNSMRALKSN